MTRPARRRAGGDGRGLDALVLDADLRQGLVAVRSLGRAGLEVGAYERWPGAPAFSSRWCRRAAVLPDHVGDARAFVDALVEQAGASRPVVIPAHDGTIEVLRGHREEVEAAATVALAPEEALAVAVDKERTLELAARLGVPAPAGVRLATLGDLDAALAEVGLPAVVKPLASWVGGQRLTCEVVVGPDEARAVVARGLEAGAPLLLQEWLAGPREAVSLLVADGRVLARFAQVAHRTQPPLGGCSVYRESIPLPGDLTGMAEALVLGAGLDGYSEVEFRRSADGRPRLMEINPRLSASVEIAVRAGVDFPLLLHRWAAGETPAASDGYRVGLRVRWLGGDIRWLRETLASPGRPDVLPAGRALARFFGDSLRPASYDYLSWADPQPALAATWGFARLGLRRAAGRDGASRADTAAAA